MKIAILINEATSHKCTGAGCLKAFINKEDAFMHYPNHAELIGFTHVGGELEKKVERFKTNGIDTIHLSSCLRSKYSEYESLAVKLSEHFNVIGYTHGKPEGKNQRTMSLTNHNRL